MQTKIDQQLTMKKFGNELKLIKKLIFNSPPRLRDNQILGNLLSNFSKLLSDTNPRTLVLAKELRVKIYSKLLTEMILDLGGSIEPQEDSLSEVLSFFGNYFVESSTDFDKLSPKKLINELNKTLKDLYNEIIRPELIEKLISAYAKKIEPRAAVINPLVISEKPTEKTFAIETIKVAKKKRVKLKNSKENFLETNSKESNEHKDSFDRAILQIDKLIDSFKIDKFNDYLDYPIINNLLANQMELINEKNLIKQSDYSLDAITDLNRIKEKLENNNNTLIEGLKGVKKLQNLIENYQLLNTKISEFLRSYSLSNNLINIPTKEINSLLKEKDQLIEQFKLNKIKIYLPYTRKELIAITNELKVSATNLNQIIERLIINKNKHESILETGKKERNETVEKTQGMIDTKVNSLTSYADNVKGFSLYSNINLEDLALVLEEAANNKITIQNSHMNEIEELVEVAVLKLTVFLEGAEQSVKNINNECLSKINTLASRFNLLNEEKKTLLKHIDKFTISKEIKEKLNILIGKGPKSVNSSELINFEY